MRERLQRGASHYSVASGQRISIEIVRLSRFNRLNKWVIRTLSRNILFNRISKREIFIVKESAVFCAASRCLKWNNA